MKTLPLNKRKNDHDYTLIHRGSKACIYEQRFQGNLVSHEVFLIKTAAEKRFKGTIIETMERFPHDEAFGYWAWSIRLKEKAWKKFNKLEKR